MEEQNTWNGRVEYGADFARGCATATFHLPDGTPMYRLDYYAEQRYDLFNIHGGSDRTVFDPAVIGMALRTFEAHYAGAGALGTMLVEIAFQHLPTAFLPLYSRLLAAFAQFHVEHTAAIDNALPDAWLGIAAPLLMKLARQNYPGYAQLLVPAADTAEE